MSYVGPLQQAELRQRQIAGEMTRLAWEAVASCQPFPIYLRLQHCPGSCGKRGYMVAHPPWRYSEPERKAMQAQLRFIKDPAMRRATERRDAALLDTRRPFSCSFCGWEGHANS